MLRQADFNLKEMSMGDWLQPCVGMKSCFDMSVDSGDWDWRAREWFVVKHAEVLKSSDNVLVPKLEMGVEARAQVVAASGEVLEDAMTQPDHPLVRYAEALTRNFDLVAERRSVIHELREVTKAQILAKFVLDSGLAVDERWLDAASAQVPCPLELPQTRTGTLNLPILRLIIPAKIC